jgi:amidophosphoribosyltransferase
MPTATELVAHNKSEDEIAAYLGTDMLIYQDLDDLKESCRQFNSKIEDFEVSVFTGDYITKDIDEEYLENLEKVRNLSRKRQNESNVGSPIEPEQEVVGLHNNFYRK